MTTDQTAMILVVCFGTTLLGSVLTWVACTVADRLEDRK